MDLVEEEPSYLSEAVVSCLQSCTNPVDRRTLLMVLEMTIERKTARPRISPEYFRAGTNPNNQLITLLQGELAAARQRPREREMEDFLDNLIQDDEEEAVEMDRMVDQMVEQAREQAEQVQEQVQVEGAGVPMEEERTRERAVEEALGALLIEESEEMEEKGREGMENKEEEEEEKEEEEEDFCHFEISNSPERVSPAPPAFTIPPSVPLVRPVGQLPSPTQRPPPPGFARPPVRHAFVVPRQPSRPPNSFLPKQSGEATTNTIAPTLPSPDQPSPAPSGPSHSFLRSHSVPTPTGPVDPALSNGHHAARELQRSESVEGVDGRRTSTSRNSSDESGEVKPGTQRGDTVYRSVKVTRVQLEAFIADLTVQGELRSLGASFLISGTEDPNHYNVTLSGRKEPVTKGHALLTDSLIADGTTYTCTEYTVPYLSDLREHGYVAALIRQLFRQVAITISPAGDPVTGAGHSSLVFKLSGASDTVGQVITFIKFVSSLPEKKFGMLFKLHPRLTSSPDLLARLVRSAEELTKGRVWSFESGAPDICHYLFVPGYLGQETHAKLQKHLNVLVSRLEEAGEGEGEGEGTVTEGVSCRETGEVTRYTKEEMIAIRGETTDQARHPELDDCIAEVKVIRLSTPLTLMGGPPQKTPSSGFTPFTTPAPPTAVQ